MHLGHMSPPASIPKSAFGVGEGKAGAIKATHNFHVPPSTNMGGMPKPPTGAAPFGN